MVLLFKVKDDQYALNVENVIEIIPKVSLRTLPRAPEYISGLLNYRGSIVPVVDLSRLICDVPSNTHLSSRIILTKLTEGQHRYVGLLAENVTETKKIEDEEFSDTGVENSASAFVDKVVIGNHGMIQHIDISRLLPEDITALLEQSSAEAKHED